eukprot:CAMPEP_0170506392 /NCGR_PEP_ID=MMETSP0208-20121228/54701_1 /TAXON_ID=197538 /ORGANISM="Strombidium inclinatum, Strain S3" /LENGTH=56 /DNA_ID=CAMNT_0010787873 /DNA_START=516 /DNA_END=683 /DNA_ORIENTATION=+
MSNGSDYFQRHLSSSRNQKASPGLKEIMSSAVLRGEGSPPVQGSFMKSGRRDCSRR